MRSRDTWVHSLSFVLRFHDHFTGEAIEEEFPIRLEGSMLRPVQKNGGAGIRQADGTYRFINIPNGVHRVHWLPPFEPSYRGWISWEGIPEVTLPIANPETVIERDLWPTASGSVLPGLTAIRGKLRGANVTDLEVRIDRPGGAQSRFTRSDPFGDFLFVLPNPIAPDNQGRLNLQIRIQAGTRIVNGGQFLPADSGTAFVGANFQIRPGKSSRIIFNVT